MCREAIETFAIACSGFLRAADTVAGGSIGTADFTDPDNLEKLIRALREDCFSSFHDPNSQAFKESGFTAENERFGMLLVVTGKSEKNELLSGWGKWSMILVLRWDADGDSAGLDMLRLMNLAQFYNALCRILGRYDLLMRVREIGAGATRTRGYCISDALQVKNGTDKRGGNQQRYQSKVALKINEIFDRVGLYSMDFAVPIDLKAPVKFDKYNPTHLSRTLTKRRDLIVLIAKRGLTSSSLRKVLDVSHQWTAIEEYAAFASKCNHKIAAAATHYNIQVADVGVDLGDGLVAVSAQTMQLKNEGTEWHVKPPVSLLLDVTDNTQAYHALEAIKKDTTAVLARAGLDKAGRKIMDQGNACAGCVPKSSLQNSHKCNRILGEVRSRLTRFISSSRCYRSGAS